jgi:hypothetical protein
VVWDPFTGSGLELVERGLLGPYARLIGSDLDPKALATAAANLKSAGLERFELHAADATTFKPEGVTLIVSNPPMGRRVQRGDVAPLLGDFLASAGGLLQPGGRLVWISPLPRVTQPAARARGWCAVGPSRSTWAASPGSSRCGPGRRGESRRGKAERPGAGRCWPLFLLCAQGRNRTADTRIFSPLLYRLSYLGEGTKWYEIPATPSRGE